jgi:hypothetical protein
MFNCPECDYQSENVNSVRIHASKLHGISSESLYLSLHLEGSKPKCACGCGEETAFISLTKGFNSYILGHAARIKNNWGHNEKARANSLEKRRKENLWSRNPWNRGKRKSQDSEFASLCERLYGNPEHKLKMSQRMTELWKNKSIVSLKGPNHPNWKGGTSLLSAMCHGDTRLYRNWKLPILKQAEFKCSQCGSNQSLHVHHSGTRMSHIIAIYRNQIKDKVLTYHQKKWVVDQVVERHLNGNVESQVLCESCHELEHPNLNFSESK